MPELWMFACFVYYTFCRPEQISQIKRADIDFHTKSLFVNAEDHKNSADQFKQLLVPMIPLLRHQCAGVDPDHYLFSRGLRPGSFHYKSTRASEHWKRLVKDGLGIKKHMYSLKATGALHYAMNNKGKESMKWLQMQLSHAELQTTSIYLNRLIASHAFYLDERQDKILDF